ncbi:DinB family protein [Paenibacillus gansuensis]|uniref:DinB family protein n=1 Tax=Paenibacillus gansuensis TaxID=306542 RepID=A0ABW5PFK4_9BACL
MRIFAYHAWANERLFQHLDGMPAELLEQESPSSFPTILQTLAHIYQADRRILMRMKEYEVEVQEEKAVSYDWLKEEMCKQHHEIAQYLNDQSDLTRTVPFPRKDGSSLQASLVEVVQHLVNHGTYHRGQITTMLRALGQKGASMDYLTFVWEGK